ncbi:MAG: tRNA (adenosine(37)-N6)-threonylcarbamoyltransferase complex dimerization subunit type 1 TsaB [Saccharospirillaceae bacterium]|nr:tRNA (adenosine(37)-N6)-threonylcarbamoyltransferase complex dimerization subunit type 1 TsaB [Pseudomonadales bacterium]NRB79566.1 tRNA (adenosine(37)-N6)-threonylcarbamoyltransferase complex dimerization subunit type 1 TsaB [Saccharospirillaceae bacterium]
MSVYLAVDSATVFCSVSVIKNDQCFAKSKDMGRNHSKQMLNMVDDVLLQASVELSDIDQFCYVRGPGSFTGVRIAASFLHGLAFGQKKDVIGISSLLTMAYEAKQTHPENNLFLVAMDARMDEVYFAAVDFSKSDWASNLIEQVIAPEKVIWDPSYKNAKRIGDGWQYLERFDGLFKSIDQLDCANKPDAQFCAKLVSDCQQNNIKFKQDAFPVYIRDDVTWKQKPKVGS